MDQAQQLWMWWHSLLTAFAPVFIMPGWLRCAPWVTGMMLCWEEQTITQILMALGLELRWRVLEHFAEYGAWDRKAVERHTLQLIEQERPAGEIFRTKTTLAVELLRQADAASRAPIIGVFDGAYAVGTVVESCLHPQPGYRRIKLLTRLRANAPLYSAAVLKRRAKGRRPLWGPRLAAPQHHLYWPTPWQQSRAWVYGRIRRFQYQYLRCRWSVSGPNTPIPCVSTEGLSRRPELVASITKLRNDGGSEFPNTLPTGSKTLKWTAMTPIHVLAVVVDGSAKPWFLVTSTLDLSAAQVVEAFTARVRQEDGFRDHKQRLGLEGCRAWTKEPVLRTFQVQLLALTLLRLLQLRLDRAWGAHSWWLTPAWNPRKRHGSILDLRRLFWRHRAVFSQLLLGLEEVEKIAPPSLAAEQLVSRVA